MSKFEDHCQESIRLFGDPYEEVHRWLDEFQGTGRYRMRHRRVRLDMLRVFFEPDPPGTFFLNANPCFLYEALSDKPVQLGYASILGDPGESFSAMLDNRIFPRLTELGYQQEAYSSAFFAICRGPDRGGRIKFGDDLLCEAGMALKASIAVDEAWGVLYSTIEGKTPAFSKQSCVGISFDESLGDRLRVSVWLIIPGHRA